MINRSYEPFAAITRRANSSDKESNNRKTRKTLF